MRSLIWAISATLYACASAGCHGVPDRHVICIGDRSLPDFSEGLAPVPTTSGWIIIDTNGLLIGYCPHEVIGSFSEARAIIRRDDRFGFIDSRGVITVDPRFDFCLPYQEGLAPVMQEVGGKEWWGYVDKAGTIIIPLRFEKAEQFSEGKAAVKRDGLWGFIDRGGIQVVGFQYEDARSFSEGLAAVKHGGVYGFIDDKQFVVIPPSFDDVGYFSEGLAPAIGIGPAGQPLWGYIDRKGGWAIACQFRFATEFNGGQAAIATRYFGYTTHLAVAAADYRITRPFQDGLAQVLPQSSRGEWHLINSAYERVSDDYDEMGNYSQGANFARKGTLLYLLRNGKPIRTYGDAVNPRPYMIDRNSGQ